MAPTLDADLGHTAYNAGATTSKVFTTSGAAAAGSKVCLFVMLYSTSANVTGAAGGSLTWRVAKIFHGANFTIAALEADAPAGMASSTAVTVSFASSGGGMVCALSILGAQTGAAVTSTSSAAGASWTETMTPGGDAMLVAWTATLASGIGAYNSPTGGASEVHDFGDPGGPVAGATEYKATTGAGSQTITGTVSQGTGFNQQIGVAFLAVGGGPVLRTLTATQTVSASVSTQITRSRSLAATQTEVASRLASNSTVQSTTQAEAAVVQRQLSTTKTPLLVNQVANPSLEVDLTNVLAIGSPFQFVRDTGGGFVGTCQLITITGAINGGVAFGGAGANTVIPVPAGATVRGSVYTKDSSAGKAVAFISQRNSDGTPHSAGDQPLPPDVTLSSGGYTRLDTGAFTLDPTCSYVRLHAVARTGVQQLQVDAAMVTLGSTLWPYFDGNSSGVWLGTSNDSTSGQSLPTSLTPSVSKLRTVPATLLATETQTASRQAQASTVRATTQAQAASRQAQASTARSVVETLTASFTRVSSKAATLAASQAVSVSTTRAPSSLRSASKAVTAVVARSLAKAPFAVLQSLSVSRLEQTAKRLVATETESASVGSSIGSRSVTLTAVQALSAVVTRSVNRALVVTQMVGAVVLKGVSSQRSDSQVQGASVAGNSVKPRMLSDFLMQSPSLRRAVDPVRVASQLQQASVASRTSRTLKALQTLISTVLGRAPSTTPVPAKLAVSFVPQSIVQLTAVAPVVEIELVRQPVVVLSFGSPVVAIELEPQSSLSIRNDQG